MRLKTLYRGSFHVGGLGTGDDKIRGVTMVSEQPSLGSPVISFVTEQGRSQCQIRTGIPASRTRNPDRNRASSKVAVRSPDSSSRIRTVRAKSVRTGIDNLFAGGLSKGERLDPILGCSYPAESRFLKERSRRNGGAFLFLVFAIGMFASQ